MMKAYPEYTDSGVEWIGAIPKHWNIARVKEQATLINGFPFDSKKFSYEKGIPLVRIRDISKSETVVRFDGDVPHDSIIDNGDILIGMDGDFNVNEWKGGKSALNQRVACIRSKDKVLQKFLFYSLPFNMKLVNDVTYYTTVKHLSNSDILRTNIALPSNAELQRIVKFLNNETARIDSLIQEKKSFIKLLQEKRQALISHVVTKGLDDNLKMKPSGVEWIGDIPEHWESGSLSYYGSVTSGSTPDRTNETYWDGNIPWVKTGEIRYNIITEAEEGVTDKALSDTSIKRSPKGTILMAMYGQGNTRGRVAILGVDAAYNQACAAISVDKRLTNTFLFNFYIAAYQYLRLEGNLTSQTNLNAEIIKKFKIVVPPINEQKRIVGYLNEKLKSYENLRDETIRSIELLKEHRTALISAAVTGKIDVREEV